MSISYLKYWSSRRRSNPADQPMPLPRPPYLAMFLFFFFTYFYFYPSGQHNDNARFDQTRAIVELGVLHIDKFRGNTADVVVKDVPVYPEGTTMWDFMPWRTPPEPESVEKNRVFPNKAPGTSFFAVPAWWLLRTVFSLFEMPTWLEEHLIPWLTIWLTIGLMTALAALCLYGVLERMLRSGPVALALTVAWALGSIAFPFSIVNFSHQFAASMLIISFAIVYCLKVNSQADAAGGKDEGRCPLPFSSPWWLALAGFLAGFSLTTEYPAVLAVGPLALYTLIVLIIIPGRKWRWAPLYAAGVIAGGMFLVWYNIKIDGKIYYIPYVEYAEGRMETFEEHKQGFMGVTFFKDKETTDMMLRNLKEITYRPQRGLFYCNPWTALVLPGLFAWAFWRGRRLECAVSAFIVVAFFIFNAGYGKTIVFWGGGWSVGPRHIIPMLPFLTILVAGMIRWMPVRIVFYPLLGVSMGIMLMASAVDPRAPYEVSNPVRDLFLKYYQTGQLAYNDMGVFNSKFTTRNSVAFNIGKLIRLKSEYQLIPLFVFWLAAVWVIIQRVRKRHAALREQATTAVVETAQSELMEYKEQVVLHESESEQTAESPPAPPAQNAVMQSPWRAGADLLLQWLRRINAPARLVFARFYWAAMFAGFALYLAVMFSIPVAYSWQQGRQEKGEGLMGQYVLGLVWKEKPGHTYEAPEIDPAKVAFSRLDEVINFDWIHSGPPIQGQFTIIWTGWLYVPEDGTWTVATESDDGSMLFINGRLAVDNWGDHHPTMVQGHLNLAKGYHPLTLVYYNNLFGGLVRLKWSKGGGTLLTIPPDNLYIERPDDAPSAK